MTAFLLTVGDEILIGQIIDTNSAWMAQQLNLQGIRIIGKASVADIHEDIIQGVEHALQKADLVLVTGGLGATKDDITKKALAAYYGVEMVWHQDTYDRMEGFFKRFGRTVNELNRNGCYMPANALILKNDKGSAPGMWFETNGKVLVSMPGVPFEMEHLMKARVLPKLKEQYPMSPIVHRTILTVGEGETSLAEKLGPFEDQLPPNVKLAYLPDFGKVRLRLTATGTDEVQLNTLIDTQKASLEAIVQPYIFGYGEETLPSAIGKLLKAKGLTLCTAESCTGGYLAHLMTLVPGCSEYFTGGIVAYDNEVKKKQLKVKSATLAKFGAVSEETVREMAQGALKALGTHVAVAITGIAGPGGGTAEKPVGTVWIAVCDKDSIRTAKISMDRGRSKNIEFAATTALNMVRKFITLQKI